MIPAIIDYATLEKWSKRKHGTLHGEIMANLDTLINTAIRYDNAVIINRSLEVKIKELENTIYVLSIENEESKIQACNVWNCSARRK